MSVRCISHAQRISPSQFHSSALLCPRSTFLCFAIASHRFTIPPLVPSPLRSSLPPQCDSLLLQRTSELGFSSPLPSWLCDSRAHHVCSSPLPLKSMQFHSSSLPLVSAHLRCISRLVRALPFLGYSVQRLFRTVHHFPSPCAAIARHFKSIPVQSQSNLYNSTAWPIVAIPLQCLSSLCHRWSCRGHSLTLPCLALPTLCHAPLYTSMPRPDFSMQFRCFSYQSLAIPLLR